MFDCAIIGGGVVGLATAMTLGRRQPGLRLVVLEKESDLALHQTGRNSGVIHSGIYYKPGSFKALFAREGNRTMVEFCKENGIPYDVCGKVVVATRTEGHPKARWKQERSPVWHAPLPSCSTTKSRVSPSQS